MSLSKKVVIVVTKLINFVTTMEKFTTSLSHFARRHTHEVRIGPVVIGAKNPIAVQSMTDTDTNDIEASVIEIGRLRAAGCHIVRLTTQGLREAESIKTIAQRVHALWPDVALVADVHFQPAVALALAGVVDKVRINPGNYHDRGGEFIALIEKCKATGTAIRIGVNHGSLARHIVEEYGDTPRGMVASAMEFLRICRQCNFEAVVVSMKSSNTRVMVQAYRLLAAEMEAEGMHYPLHLGVTEAGNGLEGRVKSAVGIGALLADGLGDTIRVSLTEPPEAEIPVARTIVNYFAGQTDAPEASEIENGAFYHPYKWSPRQSIAVGRVGGGNQPVTYSELGFAEIAQVGCGIVVVDGGENAPSEWRAAALNMMAKGDRRPIILHKTYTETSAEALAIKAACDFGLPLLDGLADGIWIECEGVGQVHINEISLAILQAARLRMSRAEFIACPSCGRTLFDLAPTLERIKAATTHLAGIKIGVMGCIVNGPGEMADADYGYVGAGPGKITLYKGQQVVRRDIPQSEALDALIELLKADGVLTSVRK
jgi:(E)-4-hydroxy-3-methylbut-2-enyl-diphosphate synthase